MSMTKEQEEQAKQQFNEDIKDVDNNDVLYAANKGTTKVEQFGDHPPGALAKLWNDIKTMISLISDYVKGDYREVPWNVIAAITGAIVYFISPIDIIPDFIPVIGYLDDALVVKLALELAAPDLKTYLSWKNA